MPDHQTDQQIIQCFDQLDRTLEMFAKTLTMVAVGTWQPTPAEARDGVRLIADVQQNVRRIRLMLMQTTNRIQ
jgi:hypothetical protein